MSARFVTNWRSRFFKIVVCFCLALPLAQTGESLGPGSRQIQKNPSSGARCVTCHEDVTESFRSAPMHHAMEPEGADPQLNVHPDLTAHLGSYTYRVETKDGHSTYAVSDGSSTVTLPIKWIFGERSQTWVLEQNGHYYESLVSYFDGDHQLAITPGDQSIKPQTLADAVGRELSVWEIRNCFTCHASRVVAGEKLIPSNTKPGLTCERCHAGAIQHREDAARGNFKTIPKPLERLNAEQISEFCGQCHRSFDTVMLINAHDIGFVRFQPYRLELSKCFIGNDPRISCITCHDPHQPVNRKASFYDSKCLACHGKTKTVSATSNAKACRIGKSNCTECHMPKVEIAGKHAQFTDHYIRVKHSEEEYPD